MDVALSVAQWVVGKALAPITDDWLLAWAASKNLGANIEVLRIELLLVKATLENASCKQLDNRSALEELLQKMQDSAQEAENVLDELDYFRIHDELNDTFDAADENPMGLGHELVQTARHTTKAVFCCPLWRGRRRAPGSSSSAPSTNQAGEEVRGSTSRLGNLFPRSTLLPNGDDNPTQSVLSNTNDEEIHSLQFSRVEVSTRMTQIVDQLRSLRTEVSTILLGCSHSVALDIARNRPITTSESIEPKLYGRDVIVNSIINDITKGIYRAKDLTVLPIVGAGGIGKTTMAQHIYHNKQVQNHFDVVIWVCVSLNFDPIKLFEEIKGKIPSDGEKDGSTTGEVIAQRLESKRFLLLMDDMWECSNEDDWKRLLLPFKKSQQNGNIIMVTTRSQELAQMVKTSDHSIELGGLEPGEFKKLFLAFVFGDEQYRMDHLLLHDIGDEIMKKLKGSPLAAKTVGRLLRKDLDWHHWTNVLESKEWETETAEHDIMPALKLSYDYLPFRLQQCFSCCALYPEDYMFTSKELIHFWIGMDILHSGSRNKTVEDIGLSNLNDLVTHGFFRKDDTDWDQRYIIHDLLHDLALKVASHDCLSLHRSNVRSVQLWPSTRHLSIIIDRAGDSDGVTRGNFKSELIKLKTSLKVENLQTLLIFGEVDESFGHIFSDLLEKANNLRVLYLPRISYPIESMFHKFSTFIHLRYLLLGTTHEREMHLPSAISRFYHLRILDLERWVGSLHLPEHFSNLGKLRHFSTKQNELHSAICNVGKLQFLQELDKFIIGREDTGFELNQISHLVDLRELGIYNLERVQTKETAAEARLIDKIHLNKLILRWESNNEPDVETLVLESLRPHNSLRDLHIGGHGGPSCPTWLGSTLYVKALKSLYLDDVAWENLPSLGQMWVLGELALKRIPTLNEFGPNHFGPITEQSFCNLKRLTLVGLEKLERWVAGDARELFSGLQVLTIEDCPELLELPFVNNVHFLPNLQVFKIKECQKLMSLPPIPWTHTLREINITCVLSWLWYSKSSYKIRLEISGVYDDESRVKKMTLVSGNLTDLQELVMCNAPPLVLTDLKMMTSLKILSLSKCEIVTGAVGDSEWQVPIESLNIWSCDVSGKVLTQLLCGLTRLRELIIGSCDKITLLDVVAEKQQMTSSSADDTQEATGVQQQEDGLLLLPSHLAACLQKLEISRCRELTLIAPTTLPNGQKAGLHVHFLPNLQVFKIKECRKLMSLPPIPWTHTLSEIEIRHVGWLSELSYSKSSYKIGLEISGVSDESRVTETILVSGNLTDLQELVMDDGPPLVLTDLKMMTSLKELSLDRCKIVTGAVGDSGWQVPIESLWIESCDVSGKVLTQLLCGLTRLRELRIGYCDKITLLDVVAEKQQMTSSSADDTQEATGVQQQEDGLLLLPSHLAACLQKLEIIYCRELTLIAPTTLPNGQKGGLQALQSLRELKIPDCTEFLSAYSSSSCCPFPSSLQELDIAYVGHMETLERLSNLTSLTKLTLAGDDTRSEGLWHLITVGQLSELHIIRCSRPPAHYRGPSFFVDWFPYQDEQESSKLHKLATEVFEGFLCAPVCRVLSVSLTILHFVSCRGTEGFTEEQAEALQLLTSLQELEFQLCTKLPSLPEGLNKLTSLKKLRIFACPAIGCLPKDGLPSSLQILDVSYCYNNELRGQCRQLRGTIPQIIL